jgi:hypothetical protein
VFSQLMTASMMSRYLSLRVVALLTARKIMPG